MKSRTGILRVVSGDSRRIVIETKRLVLQEFQTSDLPAYRKIHAHPDFQQYYSEEDASPTRARELIDMFVAQARKIPRLQYQLAIKGLSGELMGSCGIRITSITERQGSFGCELGLDYWKQGYAQEAGEAIIRFGFKKLKLHRIYAETISENHAAISLARKLGMEMEAELRENRWFRSRWWNTALLSILEPCRPKKSVTKERNHAQNRAVF